MFIFSLKGCSFLPLKRFSFFTPEKVIAFNANYSEDGKVTNMKQTGASFEDHNAETLVGGVNSSTLNYINNL